MTLFAYVNGVQVPTTGIRLRANGDAGIAMAAAADGSMSQGAIVFDDPTSSTVIHGWETTYAEETACSQPRLFTGLVGDSTERRGHYRTGAGREIDTTLLDENVFLALRLITGGDAVRPSETDTARLAWLIGSTYLSGLVFDTGWVNGVGDTFDATDYHGQYPTDVLNDLAGPRGRIFFARWDPSANKVGLFFDFPTATTNTSTLTISNVLADQDNVTCFGMANAERFSDPSVIYSNNRYKYAGGVLYNNNLTTAATYFPAPLLRRGLETENMRVGKATTALTFSNRILTAANGPAIRLTGMVRLPASKVGLIDAGQRISVKFTHLTGFTSFTYTRIESKTVAQTEGTPDSYDVTLVMSTHGFTSNGGTGGGSTDPFPVASSTPPGLVQEKGAPTPVVLDSIPVNGDLLMMWVTIRTFAAIPSTPSGWTRLVDVENDVGPYHSGSLFTRIASSESGTYSNDASTVIHVSEWAGSTFGAFVSTNDQGPGTAVTAGGAITPSAANAIVVGNGCYGGFTAVSVVPGAGVTELFDSPTPTGVSPTNWVGYKTVLTPASTTIDGTMNISEKWAGVTYTLLPTASSNPTIPGGPIIHETVTMTGASGTTAQHFAPGSLRVFVDLLDQTGAITSQTPTSGAFTLGFTPKTGEVVQVDYVAQA